MSELLKKYSERKVRLTNAFELLEKEGFVPCEVGKKKYEAKDIIELKNNLENEVFTISVCGQVNAGKSSLLNFLLFKDKDILPADDTAWTTKLSTISYGKEDKANITYYSKAEWAKLKADKYSNEDTGNETTYYDEFLKDDVNRLSFDEGINADEYINDQAKVEKSISIDDLEQYVTKKGKFTPFVSHVDITVNNDLVKGVKFVDTPGLNDPNILRSKVTEDWIIKSSAVVYLFYTGQPLAKPDYDFIDTHLSNVPSSKLLFVLTKADTSSDYQGALDYVDKVLRHDPKLKERGLLDNKEVYPISTLAAKLKYLQDSNKPIGKDDEFHLVRINRDCPDFLKQNGLIPELVSAIQEQIMKDKGQSLLEKSKCSIKDVIETKISSIKKTIVEREDAIDVVKQSQSQLENKAKEISEQQKELEYINDAFEERKDKVITDSANEITICIMELKKSIIKGVGLDGIESKSDAYSGQVIQRKLKKSVEDNIRKLKDKIKGTSIEDMVRSLQSDYISKVKEVLQGEILNRFKFFLLPSINVQELMDDLNLGELNGERLRECQVYRNGKSYEEVKAKWLRISNLESSKVVIEGMLSVIVESYLRSTSDELKAELSKKIEKFYSEISGGLNAELIKMDDELREMMNDKRSTDEKVASVKKELACAIALLEEKQDVVNAKISPLLN